MTLPASMAPHAPMTMVAAVVQLVNEGTEPFSMKYGPRDRLILAPGQSVFVQEEVAWHFLGRWWTTNADPRNRERQAEVDRLRTLYGAYEDEVLWEANQPRVVAYTADGQRITSIVDDPAGELMGSGAQTQFGREQSLESQLSILQQTVLTLQAQINAKGHTEINEAQPQVPADAVTQAAPSAPGAPGPRMSQVGGVPVPLAPESVMPPLPPTPGARSRAVPNIGEAPVGIELPVNAQVAYHPPAGVDDVPTDVPTDAPAKVKTGGRVPASQ